MKLITCVVTCLIVAFWTLGCNSPSSTRNIRKVVEDIGSPRPLTAKHLDLIKRAVYYCNDFLAEKERSIYLRLVNDPRTYKVPTPHPVNVKLVSISDSTSWAHVNSDGEIEVNDLQCSYVVETFLPAYQVVQLHSIDQLACYYSIIILHELGHVLNRDYEQSVYKEEFVSLNPTASSVVNSAPASVMESRADDFAGSMIKPDLSRKTDDRYVSIVTLSHYVSYMCNASVDAMILALREGRKPRSSLAPDRTHENLYFRLINLLGKTNPNGLTESSRSELLQFRLGVKSPVTEPLVI